MMTLSNIPPELNVQLKGNKVRFHIDGLSTDWMGEDDFFIERIDRNNLNELFLTKHLAKEIEVKNILDEGLANLKKDRPAKAIESFDEVLYYDSTYGEALIGKSHALFNQSHFVKSLRYYKRSVKVVSAFRDDDYYRLLLDEANNERSNFPRIKMNIYSGDEYFSRGEFEKAVESYDRALQDRSRFKDKILSKLLDKKANALLRLDLFEDAYDCFKQFDNDDSIFGQGLCEFELGLKLNDAFKSLLDVDKIRQLSQAMILNKSGFHRESHEISSYLMNNHFNYDDFYKKLLNVHIINCKHLNLECGNLKSLLDSINL
ncbi:tetratricopeptide repeat protein [Methanobrevibacter sp.]